MDNTIEIIREARKAGMQTALILFAALFLVCLLFGFYIYQSYNDHYSVNMNAVQDGVDNKVEQLNGKAIN